MRVTYFGTAALILPLVHLVGCKTPRHDTTDLRLAVDAYYSQNPECIWTNSVTLPQIYDRNDISHLRQFDALASVGLVKRTEVYRAVSPSDHRASVSYELTDKGRSDWKQDRAQTGNGNLCYAHRKAQAILHDTPVAKKNGAVKSISYSYALVDEKDWVLSDTVQKAFPWITRRLRSTGTASANLAWQGDTWKVQSISDSN